MSTHVFNKVDVAKQSRQIESTRLPYYKQQKIRFGTLYITIITYSGLLSLSHFALDSRLGVELIFLFIHWERLLPSTDVIHPSHKLQTVRILRWIIDSVLSPQMLILHQPSPDIYHFFGWILKFSKKYRACEGFNERYQLVSSCQKCTLANMLKQDASKQKKCVTEILYFWLWALHRWPFTTGDWRKNDAEPRLDSSHFTASDSRI